MATGWKSLIRKDRRWEEKVQWHWGGGKCSMVTCIKQAPQAQGRLLPLWETMTVRSSLPWCLDILFCFLKKNYCWWAAVARVMVFRIINETSNKADGFCCWEDAGLNRQHNKWNTLLSLKVYLSEFVFGWKFIICGNCRLLGKVDLGGTEKLV